MEHIPNSKLPFLLTLVVLTLTTSVYESDREPWLKCYCPIAFVTKT